MPNKNTFDIPPIRLFVEKYLEKSTVSIDPFARNKRWATHTNDLNPDTKTDSHLDVRNFLKYCLKTNGKVDLVIFDPPYSTRQMKECYAGIGLKMTYEDTHEFGHWTESRRLIKTLVKIGGVVLSFGWSTVGMGMKRGFSIEEILLVCHGGAHNDTICIAERKTSEQLELFN